MKQILLSALLYASFLLTGFTQTGNTLIHGRIISFEESFPLEGVSIVVKGTTTATGTQSDGTFSISTEQNQVLVISLPEYETQEVPVSAKKEYEVILKRKEH